MTGSRRPLPPSLLTVAAALLLALATFPAAAYADEHDDWELLVGSLPGPLQGACGADVEVRGIGFPSGVTVALGRLNAGAFSELTRPSTNENGFFLAEHVDLFSSGCRPGDVISVAARVVSGDGYLGSSGSPYEVTMEFVPIEKPGAITLTPSVGPGCDPGTITVTGSGFPPEVDIVIMIGGAEAYAHNFAEIDRTRTDSLGRFATAPPHTVGGQCVTGYRFAIYAHVWETPGGLSDFPKASAIYTVDSPIPASAGNAGLAHVAQPSRSLQLLLLAATAALATVGRATYRGPHQ